MQTTGPAAAGTVDCRRLHESEKLGASLCAARIVTGVMCRPVFDQSTNCAALCVAWRCIFYEAVRRDQGLQNCECVLALGSRVWLVQNEHRGSLSPIPHGTGSAIGARTARDTITKRENRPRPALTRIASRGGRCLRRHAAAVFALCRRTQPN
jgi:hypothetical protein